MSVSQSEAAEDRPFKHDIVVLLVDDQAMIGEAVRRMLAPHKDIVFHYCQDPKQALAQAAELQPTVILQDLIMPDVNGLDLVPAYRQQEATADTPLIVLSTREEGDTKAQAFALGANDYLVKLPEPVELEARIRYHSKGYIALLERREAYQALARSESKLRGELSRAADYVRSLLPEPLEDKVQTHWEFIPSEALGGDAFDYQWLDDERLAIYLLDVSGHGVGSALLSVSVLNALRSRTLPDTDFADPASVLESLNRAFPMERQNFLFFTMWYGVYDVSSRRIRCGAGGHPPALVIRKNGESLMLEPEGPMMGLDEEAEFDLRECTLEPGDQLYVYSDGVFEVSQSDEEMWPFEDFVSLMSRPLEANANRMTRLVEFTRKLQGHDYFVDDFSILEVTV